MDEFHVIPHTVAQVFPYVDQYQNALIVAGSQPIHYETEYMSQVVASYADLTEELYGNPGAIHLNHLAGLRFFQRDQSQILNDEKSRPTLRDMDPRLEYYFFTMPVREKIQSDPEVKTDFESRIR